MIQKQTADLLHQYFDKIFVVTLERATDRQSKVTTLLQGLNYEFFFGVDKNHLNLKILEKDHIYDEEAAKKLDRYGKGMMPGGIACALSHRNIYELMLEKGYRKVLIFEDDVVPVEDSLEQLGHIFSELPADWEVIYLGYTKHEKITAFLKLKQAFYKVIASSSWMKWSRTMVNNFLPSRYSLHLEIAGYHDCTHAYAVTRAAAEKLIARQTPVVLNSDDLLSDMIMKGELKAFITKPKFFDQEHFTNNGYKSYINE